MESSQAGRGCRMTVGKPHGHRVDKKSNRTGPSRSQPRADGSTSDLEGSQS